MIIIFLITYVANAETPCTLALTGTNIVATDTGSFTATFTTPASTSYAKVYSTTYWDNDSKIQIQSLSFACSYNSNSCTITSNVAKCSSLSPSTDYVIICTGINTPTYTGVSFGKIFIDFYDSSNNLLSSCNS
jgi:hypothetical protein